MGSYFGISTIFVICLLGFSANAEVFRIGSPPGSDITQVSSMGYLLFLVPEAIYKTGTSYHVFLRACTMELESLIKSLLPTKIIIR